MASVNDVQMLLVFLLVLVRGISCQPPTFNPMAYVASPPECIIPSAVHLQTAYSNCSGTIIHERWVLTAARCMYSDDETRVKEDGVTVLAGAADYTKSKVPTAQERYSQQIIIHKRYSWNTLSKFDFALVKVSTPFNLTTCVAKATIAAEPWPARGNRSKNCYSWGFGVIAPGWPNTRLTIWKTVASHGLKACPCASRFKAKRLICSTEAVGISLCRGDLGSSLLCYEGETPPFNFWLDKPISKNDFAHKYKNNNFSSRSADEDTDTAQLTLYGVAHMTIDKYKCDITRVPKETCISIPTYAAYMYLCPFNSWLLQHVPELPPNIATCGLPARISLRRTLLTVFIILNLFIL